MFRHLVCGAALAAVLANSSSAVLRHLYTFNDGTANDTAPGGTAHGALVSGASVINGQLALAGSGGSSGVSQHVSLPAAAIAINAYTSATFETWINVLPSQNGAAFTAVETFGRNYDAGIDPVGDVGWGHDYILLQPTRINDGARMAISSDHFNSETGVTSQIMKAGQNHIAMTINSAGVDNTTVNYYLNGALVGTVTGVDDLADVSNSLAYIGRSLYDGDPYYNGLVNEFRIYDEVRTAAQVQSDFATGPAAGATLTINRSTGAMSFSNASPSLQILRYTVNSPVGALDNGVGWTPVAGRVDAPPVPNGGTGNGTFDADDTWSVTTSSAASIQEDMNFDGLGLDNGGAIGSVGIGNVWKKYYQEDVNGTILVLNGATQITLPVDIVYTGNGGAAYKRSDLNFDGAINGADWVFVRTNLLNTQPGLSDVDSYVFGDIDGDQDTDFTDFRLFEADYDAVNGVGAFTAMAAAVPEPAAATLLVAGLGMVAGLRRRRASR